MFSKILVFGEKKRGKEKEKRKKERERALVLEGNGRKAGNRGAQKASANWRGMTLLKRQVDAATAARGHTCGFNSGVVETTEIHNRSLQDKRSYNYNSGL